MIVGTRKERTGGITQGDIEKVRKRVKIGDKVRIHTFKAADPDCMSSRYYGIERRGVVVGKYPHFAVVEFPGGTQESVLWVDFVKGAKGAGET